MKKLALVLFFILLFSSIALAQTCEAAQIRNALRKALFNYYQNPSESVLTLSQVQDILAFYLTISPARETIDCGVTGAASDEKIVDIVAKAFGITVPIPTCRDGTEYGACSVSKPWYCNNGRLVKQCDVCGCGSGVCKHTGKSTQCVQQGKKIVQPKPKRGEPSCTDTDPEDDPYIAGAVFGVHPNGRDYEMQDQCKGSTSVEEVWCETPRRPGRVPKTKSLDCPAGCAEGACLPVLTPTCTDTDALNNPYVAGQVSGVHADGATYEIFDICQGLNVEEQLCADNPDGQGTVPLTELFSCPVGENCIDGACVPSAPQYCLDSDDGANYDLWGTVTTSLGTFTDVCTSETTLVEHYCTATGDHASQSYTCPGTCQEGICFPLEPPVEQPLGCFDTNDGYLNIHWNNGNFGEVYKQYIFKQALIPPTDTLYQLTAKTTLVCNTIYNSPPGILAWVAFSEATENLEIPEFSYRQAVNGQDGLAGYCFMDYSGTCVNADSVKVELKAGTEYWVTLNAGDGAGYPAGWREGEILPYNCYNPDYSDFRYYYWNVRKTYATKPGLSIISTEAPSPKIGCLKKAQLSIQNKDQRPYTDIYYDFELNTAQLPGWNGKLYVLEGGRERPWVILPGSSAPFVNIATLVSLPAGGSIVLDISYACDGNTPGHTEKNLFVLSDDFETNTLAYYNHLLYKGSVDFLGILTPWGHDTDFEAVCTPGIGVQEPSLLMIPNATVKCQEAWSCTAWSICKDGSQTRACTDLNKCGTVSAKPIETQSCEGERRITTNSADQLAPNIHRDKIVWHDSRNGWNDIYMYDLVAGTETAVSAGPRYKYAPDIYENKIVWYDETDPTSPDIYMYDLSTGQEMIIVNDQAKHFIPRISGDKIVWYTGGSSIILYDLPTGQKRLLSSGTFPAIDGDKIVWQTGFTIYFFDVSSGQIVALAPGQYPSIYGDKVVYFDSRSGNRDIYLYDLSTGKETQITTNLAQQIEPKIYGNNIVWFDNRNGNWDIYMYDLAAGQERQITTDSSHQMNPDVYENKIVWHDNRNGHWDVYMLTL